MDFSPRSQERTHPPRILPVIILGTLLGAVALSQSQNGEERVRRQIEYTRAHYTKSDFRIPMRDGVRLFTTVYAPKDTSQSYPMLLKRTPYS